MRRTPRDRFLRAGRAMVRKVASVSAASAGNPSCTGRPLRGAASSARSHCFPFRRLGGGGLGACVPYAYMAASVWLMRMLFSRTSRRTVLKRKTPTRGAAAGPVHPRGAARPLRRARRVTRSMSSIKRSAFGYPIGRRGLFVLGVADRDLDPCHHAAQELAEDLARGCAPRATPPAGTALDGIAATPRERSAAARALGPRCSGCAPDRGAGAITAQAREARLPEGAPGHLAGDVRVAVAIPADPGAELEECGTSRGSSGKCLANALSTLAKSCGTTSNRFSLKK